MFETVSVKPSKNFLLNFYSNISQTLWLKNETVTDIDFERGPNSNFLCYTDCY